MGKKCLTETAVEEYNEILWLFLQENALLPFLSLLLRGVCQSALLLGVTSKQLLNNELWRRRLSALSNDQIVGGRDREDQWLFIGNNSQTGKGTEQRHSLLGGEQHKQKGSRPAEVNGCSLSIYY